MLEKRRQIRIGGFVEDDEAGIDGKAGDIDCMTMPAQTIVGLVKNDPTSFGKKPCGGEAGNAAPDNGEIEASVG